MADNRFLFRIKEKIVVLVVDDEPEILAVTKLYLEDTGDFCVDTITSAEIALKFSNIESYDAIVSDFQMPDMDGISFLKIIRKKYGTLPFILFLGAGSEKILIEAINNGADFYLQKSDNPDSMFTELAYGIKRAVIKKRAEEALQESERRYRLLADNVHDVIWTADMEMNLTYMSPSIMTLTGYTVDEALQRSIRDSITPQSYETIMNNRIEGLETIQKNSKMPPKSEMELEFLCKDGSTVWTEVILTPALDNHKNINGVIGVSRDISARKQAEEAIHRSEERFRGMAERSSDLIFIIDEQMSPAYVSPSSRSIIGYDPEELIGKPPEFAMSTIFSYCRSEIINLVGITRSGKTIENVEIKIGKKDGTPVWVNFYAVPVFDHDKVTSVQVSMRDITDTKKSEDALRKSEEKFRSFVENANEIVFSLALDGTFTYVSPNWPEILGHDTSEVLGQSSLNFIHPDDLPSNIEVLRKAIRKGEKVTGIEYRIRHKNGTWRWHSHSIAPVYNSDGNIVSIQGICHDITDRKRSDEAIRKANRQLSLLSGITRHDILNRISIIFGYLELSAMGTTEPSLLEKIQRMKLATKEIQSQIEFTRVYENLGSHEPQWLHFESLLSRLSLPDTITFFPDRDDYSIFADPMLEKVFFNLLDNSIRHGQHVTEIHVTTYESNGNLTIVWEDNGVGIADEDKDKIFERGFGKNTGLGMFLVREILLLTGISITETGVMGTGARFELLVPKGMFRKGDNG